MTPERFEEIRRAFDAMVERPPAEVAAALEKIGAADPALRDEIERLLAARSLDHPVLDRQAVELLGLTTSSVEGESLEGRQVGAYRVLRLIATGGMGAVYEAQRADDVFAKRVAVKVCAATIVGERIRERFRWERQILARLEHPNIARIMDGGATEEGSPYFVMEYVAGVSLDRHAEQRGLGLEDRLRLFCQVCDAVAYAHRNLVVHRDLKPSNILVEPGGTVKLVDFGIAKLLAEGSAAGGASPTLLRAMTPEYAAPEQVRGDAVTTATDVYQLGVVLYELLTGRRPYRLTGATTSEWERVIVEQEPVRPSASIATGSSDDRTRKHGVMPGLPPRQLQRRLRGDLDRIVLKALHKEPERRYSSADALATDIRRHLDGFPVLARGDALAYRGLKFLRRHRVGAAAAALVFLALIGGLIATSWQARRAEHEARKAETVKNFLKSLFSASDPALAQGKERTATQLLDEGARRIETDLKDQPEVQSEVVRLIASVYHDLGEYDRVVSLLRADVDLRRRRESAPSTEMAESLTGIADALYEQGRFVEAGKIYEQALEIQRRRSGERSAQVAELLWDIAGVQRNRGDLRAAEALQTDALGIFVRTRGADSREAMNVRESLAITYADSDRLRDAAATNQPVVEWAERHYGPDHPDTLNARYNQAGYLLPLGRTPQALNMAEDIMAKQRPVLGGRHGRLALSLRLLAQARTAAGRPEEALPAIDEALAIHRGQAALPRWQIALDLAERGTIASTLGRLAEAESDCRQAMAMIEDPEGIRPVRLGNILALAGGVLAETDRLEQADAQLSRSVGVFRAMGGRGVLLGGALDGLGEVARRQGQTPRAVELLRESVDILERSGDPNSTALARARVHLGAALWSSGQTAEGERLMRAGIENIQRDFPNGLFDLASARFLFGEALAESGRLAEARSLLQQCLEWRTVHLGASDPRTVAVRRALGPAP